MEVLALIGETGTGKSHHAQLVASEHRVDAIIDDGLLIKGTRILAGISAKRQPTYIGALKTALFLDPDHAAGVKEAIRREGLQRILIVATSPAMAEKISSRLELPPPQTTIRIENIATPEEIEQAKMRRQKYGQHVIPAPAVEVKPRLSGMIMEPLYTWFRRWRHPEPQVRHLWVEQTVVRPTFSYLGKIAIANHVIGDILKAAARREEIARWGNINVETRTEGVIITAEVVLKYGSSLRTVARGIQERGKFWVEHMTALNVLELNVVVKGVSL